MNESNKSFRTELCRTCHICNMGIDTLLRKKRAGDSYFFLKKSMTKKIGELDLLQLLAQQSSGEPS